MSVQVNSSFHRSQSVASYSTNLQLLAMKSLSSNPSPNGEERGGALPVNEGGVSLMQGKAFFDGKRGLFTFEERLSCKEERLS